MREPERLPLRPRRSSVRLRHEQRADAQQGRRTHTLLKLREERMQQERQSRQEKRLSIEAMALGLALQDALRDLVEVHGSDYLNTFLERQLHTIVDEMRSDTGVNIPGIRATQRSTADDAEAALRREIEIVRLNMSRRKATVFNQ